MTIPGMEAAPAPWTPEPTAERGRFEGRCPVCSAGAGGNKSYVRGFLDAHRLACGAKGALA